MTDVARRHGVESFLATVPGNDDPGIKISVRGEAGLINLRANPGDAERVEAAASVLGQSLPLQARPTRRVTVRVRRSWRTLPRTPIRRLQTTSKPVSARSAPRRMWP